MGSSPYKCVCVCVCGTFFRLGGGGDLVFFVFFVLLGLLGVFGIKDVTFMTTHRLKI